MDSIESLRRENEKLRKQRNEYCTLFMQTKHKYNEQLKTIQNFKSEIKYLNTLVSLEQIKDPFQ
jgi:hypothetical protein